MKFNITEKEYHNYLDGLMDKVNRGEELHLEQQIDFCDCLQPHLLPQYSFCDDTRFSRLYLEHFMVNEGKFLFSQQREDDLNIFLNVWKPLMERGDHSDSLMQYIAKETRTEIKELKKKSNISEGTPLYEEKVREILLHSKFIHIKVKMAFGILRAREAVAYLNGKPIHIDEYSLVHIIFRHYAEAQKQYISDKSFFAPPISVNDLLEHLLDIIILIQNSGYYSNDSVSKIYIEYFGVQYTIYCKEVEKQKKGQRGNYKVWRVNTFYPTVLLPELLDIKNNHEKKIISDNLSVFIKN